MTQGNVDEFLWSIEGEAALRPNLERLAAADLQRLDTNPSRPLGEEYELSEGDEEILSRPAYAERIRRMMQESYRTGVDGWVDDDLVFVKDWGFDIADLTAPTTIWYGEEDTLVPAAHGRWLAANVPGAVVVQMGGGHMELVDRVEELLVWLLGGAAPKDAVPGTAA